MKGHSYTCMSGSCSSLTFLHYQQKVYILRTQKWCSLFLLKTFTPNAGASAFFCGWGRSFQILSFNTGFVFLNSPPDFFMTYTGSKGEELQYSILLLNVKNIWNRWNVNEFTGFFLKQKLKICVTPGPVSTFVMYVIVKKITIVCQKKLSFMPWCKTHVCAEC